LKKTAVIIILMLSMPLLAKDSNRTEDIINNILSETPEKQSVKPPAGDLKKPEGDKKPDEKPQPEKKTAPKKDSPVVSNAEEVLLKTGIQFYNSGLYPHSMKNFRELVDKYPQSPHRDSARVWIGKILIKQYNYDEAIKEFSSVPDGSGEYPLALFMMAESNMLKRDYISAIEYYQRVFSRFPEHELADNALLNMGRLYLNTQKGTQALDATTKLIKYYKNRETIPDAYYLLGRIFEKDPTLKDYETARKVYKLFIKKAESGVEPFSKSPLTKRVKADLLYLEKRHFKQEN